MGTAGEDRNAASTRYGGGRARGRYGWRRACGRRRASWAARIVVAGLVLAGVPTRAAAQEIDTLALDAHTRFLADDLLRGRGTGTQGEHFAALYIISQLQALGIPGAGPGGEYRQELPLRRARPDAVATRLVLDPGSGAATTLRYGADFVWSRGGASAFSGFSGEARFVGTAAEAAAATGAVASAPAPDAPSRDLEGLVLVLLGTLDAASRPLLGDWSRRGAAGVIMLVPDDRQFAAAAAGGAGPFTFVNAEVDDPVWQPALPVLLGGPTLARELLGDRAPAPGTRLGRSLRVDAEFRFEDLESANVAAIVPGRDPARAREVVAYTAHYDHLGVGAPDASGDSIYNGFSDNAAGVAMLLAIAQQMAADPPARSTLFLFFTGEELGLLGSSYYATRPLVPLDRTVAVINLDAGAPPAPPVRWRIAGGNASTLGATAERVAGERGWIAESSAASPNSDHWPFLRVGVPAVFIIPGMEWEGVSEAEQQRLVARWERYHQAGDHWAEDFPFAGLRRYAQLALALGREVADAAEPPRMLRP